MKPRSNPEGLQVLVQKWKEFDLENRRQVLDKQAVEIQNQKALSLAQKKELSNQTKEWKSLDAQAKVQQVPQLLKAYQTEIDSLSQRCKATELTFLSLYKDLLELPSPVSGLEMALEQGQAPAQLQALVDMNAALKAEVEELQRKEKTQLSQEAVIVRLEARLREYETELEQRVEDAAAARERALLDETQRAVQAAKERGLETQRELFVAQTELERLQRSHAAAQASSLDERQRLDARNQALAAELSLMAGDLERARARLAAVEAAPPTPAQLPSPAPDVLPTLQYKIIQKDLQLEQLNAQLLAVERELVAERARGRERAGQLQAEVEARAEQLAALRRELAALPSLEAHRLLERELAILKAVEYGFDTADILEKSPEQLLKQKVRYLETEAMSLKAQLGKAEAELAAGRSTLAELRAAGAAKDALVGRLEADLSGRGADGHVAEVVAGQRDRLRQRCQELEDSLAGAEGRARAAASEAEATRADNLQLVAKIRYLEAFDSRRGRRDPEAPALGRYSRMYEDSLNPFQAFHETEKKRHVAALPAHEKVTLRGAQLFLRNSLTRSFLFGYSLLLHLLVFVTLYKLANDTLESHLSNGIICANRNHS